jgi:DNA-binding transcriptional LysR family regulator
MTSREPGRPDDMEVFVAVVDAGGFSPVARQLGRTPSAVSRQITRLEARLGAPLLHRSTRSMGATDAGRCYYEHCRDILERIAAAEQAVTGRSGRLRGTVTLSLSPAVASQRLIPALPTLFERHPELGIELRLGEAFSDLYAEGVDVAVRIAELGDSSLIARRLTHHRRVVCASPAYLERRGVPATPGDLAEHDCLTVSVQPSTRRWDFDGPDGTRWVDVSGRFVADTAEALREAALAGIGIARLSRLTCEADLRAGRLVALLEDHAGPERTSVYAVYPPHRQRDPRVQAVVAFLAEIFEPVAG